METDAYERPKIKLSDSENVDNIENQMNYEIRKNIFMEYVKKFKLNVSLLFQEKMPSLKESYAFNTSLRQVNEEQGIPISECLLILEEHFVYFKRIVRLLDEENIYTVKSELSEKYTNAKVIKNNLFKFLERSDKKKDGFAVNKNPE